MDDDGCGIIVAIVLWILYAGFVLGCIGISLGLGLMIGVFPGVYHAISNYHKSVNESITHPMMRFVSFSSLYLGVGIILVGVFYYFSSFSYY